MTFRWSQRIGIVRSLRPWQRLSAEGLHRVHGGHVRGFAIEPAPARRAATVSGFKPSSAKAASEWAAAAAKASAKTRQSNPASFSAASLHNRSSGYRSDNAATSTKSRAAARPNNARVWSAAT
jgi:hypothetical protein